MTLEHLTVTLIKTYSKNDEYVAKGQRNQLIGTQGSKRLLKKYLHVLSFAKFSARVFVSLSYCILGFFIYSVN